MGVKFTNPVIRTVQLMHLEVRATWIEKQYQPVYVVIFEERPIIMRRSKYISFNVNASPEGVFSIFDNNVCTQTSKNGGGDGWIYKKTKGFTLVVNSYKSLNSFIFLKPELSLNVIVTLC